MKLSINQHDLYQATQRIQIVHNAFSGELREEDEKLRQFTLLEATKDQLILRGTTSDTEIRTLCPAEVETPGTALVWKEPFCRIARNSPKEHPVKIETEHGGILSIENPQANYDLNVSQEDLFPNAADPVTGKFFEISGRDFLKICNKTLHAAEQVTDQRFNLAGLYIHILEDNLIKYLGCTATDGKRLAFTKIPAPKNTSEKTEGKNFILHHRLVRILLACIEPEQKLQVKSNGKRIQFSSHGWEMTVGAIEGGYPDYPRVIPKDGKIRFDFNTEEIRKSLRQVISVTKEGTRVKIFNNNGDIKLETHTQYSQSGDIVRESKTTDPIEIIVNGTHLQEIFDNIQTENSTIEIIDNKSPCLITENLDDLTTQFVIMPYRN